MTISIPFNDTSRIFEEHRDELQEALLKTVQSGRWLLGKKTIEFSKAFSKYCGVKYCLPVANGTDALELALRSIIPEPKLDDEVITVANAGGYSSTVCHTIGVTPVYADVEERNHLIDIESLIRSLSPSVKAIIITHLYGAVVNIPEIKKRLAETNYQHIPIIEDCAQAHGAKVNGASVGSLGDVATFSFYPTKNLGALGDAGAIVTSDQKLFDKLSQLHQYGWDQKYHVQTPFGRNSRMDEIQASVLTCLLPYLDSNNKKRIEIIDQYKQVCGSRLKFLDYSDRDFVGHLAIATVSNRDEFITFMKSENIATDNHYPILDCDQIGWRTFSKRIDPVPELKVSQKIVNKIVSIPCFPTLKDDEIEHVCKTLAKWENM